MNIKLHRLRTLFLTILFMVSTASNTLWITSLLLFSAAILVMQSASLILDVSSEELLVRGGRVSVRMLQVIFLKVLLTLTEHWNIHNRGFGWPVRSSWRASTRRDDAVDAGIWCPDGLRYFGGHCIIFFVSLIRIWPYIDLRLLFREVEAREEQKKEKKEKKEKKKKRKRKKNHPSWLKLHLENSNYCRLSA